MRKIYYTMAVLATLALASSCVFRIDKKKLMEQFNGMDAEYGNGIYKVRDTTVQPFNVLSICAMTNVEFIQESGSCSVQIFASENVLPYVFVRQDSTVLNIYTRTPDQGTVLDSKMKITVHAPSLSAIDISGMCGFECSHLEVPGEYFKMDVSGVSSVEFGTLVAGKLFLDIDGVSSAGIETLKVIDVANVGIDGKSSVEFEKANIGKLMVDASGMSNLNVKKGKAGKAVYEASDMSNINARGLDCSDTRADASDMSKIKY